MINTFDRYIQFTACIVHLTEAKQALILAGASPSDIASLKSVIDTWVENLLIARKFLSDKYGWPADDDFGIHKIGETYVILFESGKREERKP